MTDVQRDPLGQLLYGTGGRNGRIGLWRLTDDKNQLELLSLTNTSLGWIARLRWIDQQLTYLAFQSVGRPMNNIFFYYQFKFDAIFAIVSKSIQD